MNIMAQTTHRLHCIVDDAQYDYDNLLTLLNSQSNCIIRNNLRQKMTVRMVIKHAAGLELTRRDKLISSQLNKEQS